MSAGAERGRCTWSEDAGGAPRRIRVATRAGEVRLLLRGGALARLVMAGASEAAYPEGQDIGEDDLPPQVAALPAGLRAYFAGEPVDLATLPLLLCGAGMSAFARRVYARLREVPRGETLSYGELARDAGSPRAARAVGGLMARNPWPLVVPCHRVLPAGGGWGGFSAPGGVASKMALLELEGALQTGTG